jgi:glycosyltransferase involved in cell wall biosynthesis/GT2 family glycosyltransferase
VRAGSFADIAPLSSQPAEFSPLDLQRRESAHFADNGNRLGTLQCVQEAEVLDPGERRARLDDELRTAQREARRLGRRLETLDRERAERVALIETLEAEVARTAESRSFRYGHGVMRRFSRWLLRRPARESGLDSAAGLLVKAHESLVNLDTVRDEHEPAPTGPDNDGQRGLRIGFIEPHLGAVGGIRRILETSNRLVDRGHEVSIYLPVDQPLECDWMECKARLRQLDAAAEDELDFIVFNHEPQWYLLRRFPRARYRVFFALSYSRAYEKSGSWESMRALVDLRLANSKWTADRIAQEIGVRPTVVPTGIDRELFHPRDLKKRFPVLCIGDSRPWKGTETIERACVLLDLDLQKVHGKGLKQDELAKEYCRAEVFVVGSPVDGFGFPGLEALSCGTPLVTTDNGGCREYAIHEETALIVPPDDPEAMASAIARLRSDPQLRERLVRNGLRLVAERFSWDHAAEGFERELLALARREPSPVAAASHPLRPPEERPEISIIILSFNTRELLMRCIESARQHTDVPYELIVVDNASSDDSAEYAAAAADRAILNERNAGFSGGFNQGSAAARGRLVFFLNSDTKLPPSWASRLKTTIDRYPDAGIVFPAVTAASNPVTVRTEPGDRVVAVPPYLEPPSGVALLMRTDVVRALGGWNELYDVASGEDTDLCFTVWVNGLSTVLDEAVLIEHVAKASAKQLPDQKLRWAMNRRKFLERWTGPLGDLPRLDGFPEDQFEENKQVARGVAFWMQRYFSQRDNELLARDPATPTPTPPLPLQPVGALEDQSENAPKASIVYVPVRLTWRMLRPLVPKKARNRYYRRHRSRYERVFPEHIVRSGDQGSGRSA